MCKQCGTFFVQLWKFPQLDILNKYIKYTLNDEKHIWIGDKEVYLTCTKCKV